MDTSILYVDIENLQEIARQALKSAFEQWPTEFPRPGILKLYVRADMADLWKNWAQHHIPSVEVQVKGVQHYTYNGSKNSADLALALDAIIDILKDKTKFIAIMSDDSDYVALFSAIKQETGLTGASRVSFKWLMTNRSDTRSSLLLDFFPAEYVYTIECSSKVSQIAAPENIPEIKKTKTSEAIKDSSNKGKIANPEKLARIIITHIPVGLFKSADCKKVLEQYCPGDAMIEANDAQFGTLLVKNIWPILKKYGVLLPNPNKKPRKYEMTDEAKKKVAL